MGRLAGQLELLDSPSAARYLRTWEPSIQRIDRGQIVVQIVPWTFNAVERGWRDIEAV